MTAELLANSPVPGSSLPISTLAAPVNTTPAPGTAETWTYSTSVPTALQTAGGQFRIVVDGEICLDTTGGPGTTRQIQRGMEGSTVSTHASGANVYHELTAGGIANFITSSISTSVALINQPNLFSQPQTFKSSIAVGFTAGGSPKYPIPSGSPLGQFDASGNLLLGQNFLLSLPVTTLQTALPDFAYLQQNPRVLTRNLTLTELDDPPDLNFRRFGPVGGYPYGGGYGAALASTTNTITVGNVNNTSSIFNFVVGQQLVGDGVSSIIPPNTVINSVGSGPFATGSASAACSFGSGSTVVTINSPNGNAPVPGATVTGGSNIQAGTVVLGDPNPTASTFSISLPTLGASGSQALTISAWSGLITLTLSNPVNVLGSSPVFSIGRTSDLTAVGAGGTIGQIRCSPAVAPYLGTVSTPGAKSLQESASIGFRLEELPRDLTGSSGGNDIAIGTQMRFNVAKIGRQSSDAVMVLSSGGKLLIGMGAVAAGDVGGDIAQIRGHAGQNEIHQLTTSGSPTGTFKVSFVPDATTTTNYPAQAQSAAITYPPSAGSILSALSNIQTGSQTVQCSFAFGSTAITIKVPNGSIPIIGQPVTAAGIPGGATVIGVAGGAPADPTASLFYISAATTANTNGTSVTVGAWLLGLGVVSVTGGPLPNPIVITYTGFFATHHWKPLQIDNSGLTGGSVKCSSIQTGLPTTQANRLLFLKRESASPVADYFTVQDFAGTTVLQLLPSGTLSTPGDITANTIHVGGASGNVLAHTGGGFTVDGNSLSSTTVGTHAARLAASATNGLLWRESETGVIYRGNGSTWDIWKADGTVRKTSDQTISSTGGAGSLVNDNDLHFLVEPNEVWLADVIMLSSAASANADWIVGFSGPTGATADWGVMGRSAEFAGGIYAGMVTTTTGVNTARTIAGTASFAATSGRQITLIGGLFVVGGNAGTITFRWAQNTSTAENNAVLTNSIIRLRRIA